MENTKYTNKRQQKHRQIPKPVKIAKKRGPWHMAPKFWIRIGQRGIGPPTLPTRKNWLLTFESRIRGVHQNWGGGSRIKNRDLPNFQGAGQGGIGPPKGPTKKNWLQYFVSKIVGLRQDWWQHSKIVAPEFRIQTWGLLLLLLLLLLLSAEKTGVQCTVLSQSDTAFLLLAGPLVGLAAALGVIVLNTIPPHFKTYVDSLKRKRLAPEFRIGSDR